MYYIFSKDDWELLQSFGTYELARDYRNQIGAASPGAYLNAEGHLNAREQRAVRSKHAGMAAHASGRFDRSPCFCSTCRN